MVEIPIPKSSNLWLCGYYAKIKKDIDGWVDVKEYLPIAYDLVYIKTDTITFPGWWTGNGWAGRRYRNGMQVIFWKKEGI